LRRLRGEGDCWSNLEPIRDEMTPLAPLGSGSV
jgi:hypothetical protein